MFESLAENRCFTHYLMPAGMHVVSWYFQAKSNVFLNTRSQEASCLEASGNACLSGLQYLLGNTQTFSKKKIDSSNEYEFIGKNTFDESNKAAMIALAVFSIVIPVILFLGLILKGLAYLSSEVRERNKEIYNEIHSTTVKPVDYSALGINGALFADTDFQKGLGLQHGPLEDPSRKKIEFTALQDISAALNSAKTKDGKPYQIPYWADCGTALGVYRYGGWIPWDLDVDIGIPQTEHDNVMHALQALDPDKYEVQDWSPPEMPKCYLKVFIKESGTHVDIYHYAIDTEKQTLQYIFHGENACMPEWWKNQERRQVIPYSYDDIFPLQRAEFHHKDNITEERDGASFEEAGPSVAHADILVPNNLKAFLQEKYARDIPGEQIEGQPYDASLVGRRVIDGSNITPVKDYNPATHAYERVERHPYWVKNPVK